MSSSVSLLCQGFEQQGV